MKMVFECKDTSYLFFKSGDSLRDMIEPIPEGYGVYIFHKNVPEGEILYIGKGGTIEQNGNFKKQKLKKRIVNKHDGVPCEDFLNKKINESNDLEKVCIEWYIVDEEKYLPGFIEAKLLQDFYAQYGCLPIWNKNF